jgi:hypothetical protein
MVLIMNEETTNTEEDSVPKIPNNPEEWRILLNKFYNDLNNSNIQIDDNGDFNDQPQKLLDCPHEIIFSVNATVMSQNEKGEHVGTKQICTKNYHIPVPIGKDYDTFMQIFFNHIEKSLESSYQQTELEIGDKDNG